MIARHGGSRPSHSPRRTTYHAGVDRRVARVPPAWCGDRSERHRRPEEGSHLIGQKPRGDRPARLDACRSGG